MPCCQKNNNSGKMVGNVEVEGNGDEIPLMLSFVDVLGI